MLLRKQHLHKLLCRGVILCVTAPLRSISQTSYLRDHNMLLFNTYILLGVVVATIAVHFASCLAWIVLPHHRPDWKKLELEDDVRDFITKNNIGPGQFMFPCYDDPSEMKTDEFQERMSKGPWGTLMVWKEEPNMGKNIGLTILFFFCINFILAYIGTIAFDSEATFMQVFRLVSTAGILAFSASGIQHSIWFKRRILMDVLDGIVYGILSGLVIAGFWQLA